MIKANDPKKRATPLYNTTLIMLLVFVALSLSLSATAEGLGAIIDEERTHLRSQL